MDPVDAILRRYGPPALGGLLVRDGRVALLDVAGVRRRDRPARVQRDDPWHIGSNTKAITAMMLADLVAEGRARWTQTVLDVFPELRARATQTSPSLSALLSHKTGLSDEGLLDESWAEWAIHERGPLPEQRLALVEAALAGWRPARAHRFAYANVNYVIGGAVIERLARSPWEAAARAMVFAPLGLRRAGFGAPLSSAPWGHGADGSEMRPNRFADNPPVMGPSGTVHLSLDDYAKVLIHMLREQSGLLSCALHPPPGMRTGYRLGWRYFRHRAWARGPVLAHEGSNTLWHCVALLAPKLGAGIVAVSNQGGPIGAKASRQLTIALTERLRAESEGRG